MTAKEIKVGFRDKARGALIFDRRSEASELDWSIFSE